ncbi:Apolipoprotein D [Mizuhopecten yessoensis]|uniref:Apolipoprotein D n=1 Tax=Mizuhopecten yessoensis TaxID=6573 RepID=A0A210PNF2_MIZYE|nr:Apolipoprotein D [Mizuhopecten yessoensis]
MCLRIIYVLVTLLLSNMVAYGQILTNGKCPVVEPMTDFKIQPFLGVWYEVFRFYDQFEEGQSCIRMEYTLKPNEHIGLHNYGDLPDNTTVVAEGDGYVSDPSIPARYMVTFSGSKYLTLFICSLFHYLFPFFMLLLL